MRLREGNGRGVCVLSALVLIAIAVAWEEASGQMAVAGPPAPRNEVVVRSVQPTLKRGERPPKIFVYGITYKDRERLAALPGVKALVPVRAFPQQARYLKRAHPVRVVGTTSAYGDRGRVVLAAGRFLNEKDEDTKANVCVLGATAAARLFPQEDPLGKTVQLKAYFYKVVGVLRSAKAADNDVYIPLQTCRVRYGDVLTIRLAGAFRREQVELTEVRLVLEKPDLARPTLERARKVLKAAHSRKDWDVSIDPPPVKGRAP